MSIDSAVSPVDAADDDGARRRYLDLMSAFPTGVGVVTSVDECGMPHGMTCSSITSATLAPPTLLVCLRVGSRTLDAVSARGAFAVNLLHHDGQHAAEVFSRPGGARFSRVGWRPSASGLPWLVEHAFAVAECRISDFLTVGDHAVVLGEVTTTAQIPATPLLYGRRRFAPWPLPQERDPLVASLLTETVNG